MPPTQNPTVRKELYVGHDMLGHGPFAIETFWMVVDFTIDDRICQFGDVATVVEGR